MERRNIIILLTILMSIGGVNSFAQDENYYDVEVDGFYYRLTNDGYYDEESNTFFDGTATLVNPNGDDGGSWELPAWIWEGEEMNIPSPITVYDDNYELWDSEYEKTYCVTAIGKNAFYEAIIYN